MSDCVSRMPQVWRGGHSKEEGRKWRDSVRGELVERSNGRRGKKQRQ